MLTEQDLIKDKWKLLPNGYTKLGVTIFQRGEEWQCHFVIGQICADTDVQFYNSLAELYDHIKTCVRDILNPAFELAQLLTISQKRTLKNWIL